MLYYIRSNYFRKLNYTYTTQRNRTNSENATYAEHIEAALRDAFVALVTAAFLGACRCVSATTGRVSSALGIGSEVHENCFPENTLANGVYEQYTLFIDTPCVMYGESCTKTVIDYYWAYIDGSPEAVLIRVD